MDSNVQLLVIFFLSFGSCIWGSNEDWKVELVVLLTSKQREESLFQPKHMIK